MRLVLLLPILFLFGCSGLDDSLDCYSCVQKHQAHFAGDSWKPYVIKNRFGARRFVPLRHYKYSKVGLASWYGEAFHNKKTASGMMYDMHKLSAAHPTLPLPCLARVTNLENGKHVVVLVNDRGPYVGSERIIDLSVGAAKKLGFYKRGLAKVKVEVLEQHTKEMISRYALNERGRANNKKANS